jgi:GAF domain-containing protein
MRSLIHKRDLRTSCFAPGSMSDRILAVPNRSTTVRFGEDLWTLLEREAAREGLSAAQYVRDAAVLRLAFAMADHGDPQAQATLADVATRALARRPGDAAANGDGPAGGDGPDPILGDTARRAALVRTGLMDGPMDEAFDRIASIVARVLDAPAALVSLVDQDKQVFAGCIGLPEPWATDRETPLSHSFCQHAVATREPLIIPDARKDPRVRDNLAIRDLNVIAYAGMPLIDSEGHALGSLCAIDDQPRAWTDGQIDLLRDLAATVVSEIESRSAR